MKVLAIAGSPRAAGNTSRLVALAEQALRDCLQAQGEALEMQTVHLARMQVQTCLGCRACFGRGELYCPLHDDVASLRDKLLWADALILASPVYVENVSGIMKNWIDRMAYGCHRPFLCGKPALVLTTSGGGATMRAAQAMATALTAWGTQVTARRNFRMGARMEEAAMQAQFGQPLLVLAAALYQRWQRQNAGQPNWYGLVAFTIQQRHYRRMAAQAPCLDSSFWQDKGWLRPDCRYYSPVRATLKTAIARLLGRAVSMFFV